MRIQMAALTGLMLLGGLPAVAQSSSAGVAAPAGGVTDAGLKEMLDGMGYEPRPLSKGYLLAIKRDTWTIHIQLVLSKDLTKIGMNANLGLVSDAASVPAATWLKLLADNGDIDPSAFYYDKDQKKLYLHRVMDNRAVTPAVLRRQIEAFCDNTRDTAADWNFTK
jgi:hypothetical protein